jgi:hypothetical protein
LVNLIKTLSIQGKEMTKMRQKPTNLGINVRVISLICVTDIKIEIVKPKMNVIRRMGALITIATKIV